ncbi:MAG: sialate O-acetylesterase [Prevotellaceae bacterium]|nr:sialate O-acetylesterase [Prevotellaceae bacterium]MDD7376832.1 sialate O-acetylesterase [Prevotellaceae bacterium]
MNKIRFIAAFIAFMAIAAKASITLPSYYASGMVLQQKSVFQLKGKSTPNANMMFSASWDKVKVYTNADSEGNFSFKVTVPEASTKTYALHIYELQKKGNRDVVIASRNITQVYAGEVWFCSGQSNMQMPVQGSWGLMNNYQEEIKNANYPMIKLLSVAASGKNNHPADDTDLWSNWVACSPSTIPDFSALAYCFGRELYKNLNIPIGLIQCAYGGSNAEAWVSLETARTIPALKTQLDKCAQYDFHRDSVSKYLGMKNEFQVPTLLYNTMVHPMINFPIRGVIWYQGEANAWGSSYYTALMDSLISSWRKDWGYKFPFYTVQLAAWQTPAEFQENSNWAALRWDQWKTSQQMDSTGMATAVDVGNATDIHPKNKQEVGRRLALIALKNTYGFDVVADAPKPVSYRFEYKKAYITFDKKIHVRNDSVPVGFRFKDRSYKKFYAATAKVVGEKTIEISVSQPLRPSAIYYNWADYPIGNIYGENNLPVLPFRTDQMNLIDDLVGIDNVRTDAGKSNNVYTTDGVLIKSDAGEQDMENLPKGIYVIGNKKKLVK